MRIVATTNRDLAEHVQAGGFREDLYYRLAVVPVQIPPLRERLEDIPLLVQHFAARTPRDLGRPVPGITPECIDVLQEHAWPGNLRELSHAVERAVILTPSGELTPESFDRRRFGLAPAAVGGPEHRQGADGGRRGSGHAQPLRDGGHPDRAGARRDGEQPHPRRRAPRHQRPDPPQQAEQPD